jgi:cyclophilin family peptidyl-prolyl cis-trans isomerase
MASAQQPSTASIETDFGTIELELWPDAAPLHVANFRKLARAGFYRGTGFHRIVPGFVIQGGCPEGDGTGGPGWTVPAEFNARRHVKGVLSMARSAHPDSAGSQFFICLGDAPHLDGQYSAFGRVTAGMDVVEQIAAVECDAHGRPVGRLPEMRIVNA